MELNWFVILGAGFIPLIIGSVWYSPALFASAWMKEAGLIQEDLKKSNLIKVFGLTLIFGMMLAVALTSIVIHQMGAMASLSLPEFYQEGSEVSLYFKDYLAKYGQNFRSFKHGALHGTITGIFIFLPIIGVNALFERKSWKYILINVGFWTLCSIFMGGIICAFA
jgi:hypothetical protein